MYYTFKLLHTTIFYCAAILILLNPKSYKNSKHIFSYFIVSVYCSLLLDLNLPLFSKESIYNSYDLFIIPSIIWGSYFQKNLKHCINPSGILFNIACLYANLYPAKLYPNFKYKFHN